MNELFLKIANMSISASCVMLAVLVLRLLLKKAPKWVNVLLWGFVALRLLVPFSIESNFSLIPDQLTNGEIISNVGDAYIGETDSIGIYEGHEQQTGQQPIGSFDTEEGSIKPPKTVGNTVYPVLSWIWLAGVALMLIYTVISYATLQHKIRTAVPLRKGILQSENVDSPFVLGIIKPKIYLPFRIDEQTLEFVIAHEQAHILRKDHWWKPFGFLLLAIHWFNPLIWLGYILLCRDIELACDEKVIKEMDHENRANYTQALFACSINRRSIAACPLAFGEVGIKERVKSVMNYRKPTFWITVAAAVICYVVVICFLTDPMSNTLGQIEWFDFDSVTYENTAAFVSDGKTQHYIGAVDRELIKQLYKLRISHKEVSLDRSEERDRSNTLILNLPPHEPGQIMTSYVGGTFFHFNDDFSEVWVDDHVKPTLTYKVLDPHKARSIYQAFVDMTGNTEQNPEPVETFTSDFATYYKNGDGTWQKDGRVYKYRLEITGRMPRASVKSTFIYLSNLEEISFERAYMAAGLSSQISSYFAPEEAVLVDWITHGINSGDPGYDTDYVLKTDKLDASISEALLNHHKDVTPDGLLNTESHIILVKEVASGTPLAGQTGHIREETVYVYYLVQRFNVQGERPEAIRGIYGQAAMTFTVDENGIYSLKHFMKPESSVDSGADYDAELTGQFISASEKIAENEEAYNRQLQDSCLRNATDYMVHIINQAVAQPGGVVSTPLIDGISYDLDGDGTKEMCSLTYGPTYGLFSFCFNASSMEPTASAPKYSETFVLTEAYHLSFDLSRKDVLRIKGEPTVGAEEAVYFEVAVKDEKIELHCDEKPDALYQPT